MLFLATRFEGTTPYWQIGWAPDWETAVSFCGYRNWAIAGELDGIVAAEPPEGE